jgi:rubrerythrin
VEEETRADQEENVEEWSAEQRRELRRALEVRRRRQVVSGQWVAGVLLALVAGGVLFRVDAEHWIPAVGIVALAALAFRLTNWKCPGCGERLPTRSAKSACPGCGLPLE